MSTTLSAEGKAKTVIRVTSGNFLEMFDFFLFGFYASQIGKTFFPGGSEFASLMFTFVTFGVGFLMRPLGAIILGAYIDQVGRRKGLIVTISLMALGTVLLAFTPGYATIGITAQVLVLAGRLIQGFSAGVELGGVSVYLSEMATPGHKGFYVSWQSGSQQVAIILAAALATCCMWLSRRPRLPPAPGASPSSLAVSSCPSSTSSAVHCRRPRNFWRGGTGRARGRYFPRWCRTGSW